MKTPWFSISAVVAACLALAGPARAERAPSGEIIALELPGFATMDRGSEESFAEVAAGMSFFEGEDPDFNARADLYAQYLVANRTGGYAALPLSLLIDGDENETAVGNLEIGALHNLRASPRTAIVLRAGLMLPTADDDLEGALVNAITAYSRFTDLPSVMAKRTYLRLAASPMYRSGEFFARADVGLDLVLDEPEGADSDTAVRLNLGAGFTNGAIALMGELVSVGTTSDSDDDQRFHHTAAVSVRGGMGSGIQGFAAILLPLDDDNSLFGVDFVIIAGTRVPIKQ